jgi:hypothetical protein
MTGLAYANQSVTLVPPTDANRASMLRSIIWSQPSVTLSAVPAGTYDVWVYVWEDNFPVTYSVLLEGNVVQANYNSGSAGTWRKLGPFRATINDGTINVRLNGAHANFSGVEVWTAQSQSSGRVAIVTTPGDEEMHSHDDGEPSSDEVLAFYPNPFSTKATIVYTATQAGLTGITLYDVRGVKKWSSAEKYVDIGHKESVEIETSSFEYGVYVLELINGRGVKRQKVVKVN